MTTELVTAEQMAEAAKIDAKRFRKARAEGS
jgi:hypothetical protein